MNQSLYKWPQKSWIVTLTIVAHGQAPKLQPECNLMVCGGTFKYKDKLVLDNYLHTPSQGEEVGLVTRIIFTQVYDTLIHPAPTESKRFYFPEQRPQRH